METFRELDQSDLSRIDAKLAAARLAPGTAGYIYNPITSHFYLWDFGEGGKKHYIIRGRFKPLEDPSKFDAFTAAYPNLTMALLNGSVIV